MNQLIKQPNMYNTKLPTDSIPFGSGYVDKYEKKLFEHEINTVRFPSNYNFLSTHNGFRNGEMHIFMAVESGGKSTLIRSMLFDIISRKNDCKIMVMLSEESITDFRKSIAYSKTESVFLKNVDIYSEQDFNFGNPKIFIESMYKLAYDKQYDIILFDNITTSICYSFKNGEYQEWSANQLKRMIGQLGIPLIIIAHADSDSSKNRNRIMESSHIRGNKTLPNLAQYFYIMQHVMIDNTRLNFIRISKHRSMPNIENYIFRLQYNANFGIFSGDMVSSFEEFKEKFKLGNKI